MSVTESDVLAVLNSIIDPCSIAMGEPAGLVDMGMIQAVRLHAEDGGLRIEVELLMTEAGCLMSVPFRVQAIDDLIALPDVVEVAVGLNTSEEWDEGRMTPDLRSALDRKRSARRADLGIPQLRDRVDAPA